jgi:hypothetical protein
MSDQDRMHRNQELDGASDHLGAAGEHTAEAARQMKNAGRHAGEAMQAGAAGTAERASDAASAVGRAAGAAKDGAADAARTVGGAAKSGASTAAGAVGSAASTAARVAGSTASTAAGAAGSAASAVGSTVGAAASRIAEKAGGWWSSARDAMPELPNAELELCRERYAAHDAASDEFTMDVALAAYALGYAAAQNPAYGTGGYESAEADLRHGFTSEAGTYHAWSDFSRYGYERGAGF